MGAIVGFVGDGSRALLDDLVDRLAHRGAHRRSLTAAQYALGERNASASDDVSTSSDGRVHCVFDGRLLDHGALLSELGGDDGWDDARIVAELFAREGTRAFERLDGPFALALVDGEHLHVVRDPLGEKPVYYAEVAGCLLFGSEIKAFLAHPAFRVVPEPAALLRLLVFSFIPGAMTAFRGVSELLPGCRLQKPLAGGAERVVRYWELEEKEIDASEDEMVEHVGMLLRDAVRRRLPPSGTPIAAFLSGGIDSSAVIALLRELGRDPVCFSAGFGFGQPNELMYASLVSAHTGVTHHVVDVEPEGFLDLLPQVMWSLDDPLCDCITVPNYILARTAAREAPIVFNGEGGDPLFGGPKNKFMILGEWYAFLGGYQRSRAYLASYHKFFDHLDDLCTPEFMSQAGGVAALEADVSATLEDPRLTRYLNRLMHINIRLKGGQNILVKVDKMLTPNGVEAASPLFDKRLAEYSFAVPPRLKRRGDVEKWIFKKAVENTLPHPVVYRKKAGMGVPLNHWFRKTALRSYTRDILGSERARQRGYFRPEFVSLLLSGSQPESHVGRDRSGELLWMLLAVELWHRVYVDGDMRP
ncbi:MAG: asparagine synthase-related protein [Polyangiaceae bacterium]